MKKCLNATLEILLAEEGLGRETLMHCRQCPACRKLLERRLRFIMKQDQKVPSVSLDSMTLAACLQKHQRRRMFRRTLIYACSFAFCILCLAGTTYWIRSEKAQPENPERNELAEELADIRFSLTRISREITLKSGNQTGELQ